MLRDVLGACGVAGHRFMLRAILRAGEACAPSARPGRGEFPAGSPGATAPPVPGLCEGCGRSSASLPEGLPRADPGSLTFVGRREDLVLVGAVGGVGKTHMASVPMRCV